MNYQPPSTEQEESDAMADNFLSNLRKKIRYDEGVDIQPIASSNQGQGPLDRNNAANQVAQQNELPERPFANLIVYVHKKLEDQQINLSRTVEKLGGQIRFQHCREVTHFVYEGKLAATKEIRSAKEWQQKFVTPQWILDCEDTQVRLDEGQYHPSLNSKMVLSISVSSQPPPGSSTQKRRQAASTPRSESRNPSQQPGKLQTQATAVDAVDLKPTTLFEPVQEKAEEKEDEDATCKELLQLNEVLSRSREPTMESCSRKTATVVARNSRVFVQPTQDIDINTDSQSATDVEWNLHETQKVTPAQSKFCVMFSSMESEDREFYMKIVDTLGGLVSTTTCYDSTASHIVVSRPVRNEKLVSSIAAGKWVLCPQWLDASSEAGHFVEEQDYEWGNPSAIPLLKLEEGSQEASVAAAAHRHRLNKSRGLSSGAFNGFKAILHVRDKNGSFQRLLEAGGGQIVQSV